MKIFESDLFISRNKVDNSALEEYAGIPVQEFSNEVKLLFIFVLIVIFFCLWTGLFLI